MTITAEALAHDEIDLRDTSDFRLDLVSVAQIIDPLRPGDIIVCKTTENWISRLVSALDGYWCHSAIYIGDGMVAHSQMTGIGIEPIDELMDRYESGMARLRPGFDGSVCANAAEWATRHAELSAQRSTPRYGGCDLGLAVAVLRRARQQGESPSLADVDQRVDDVLEGLLRTVDSDTTCSGFVYRAYLEGASTALNITDTAAAAPIAMEASVTPNDLWFAASIESRQFLRGTDLYMASDTQI